MCPPDKPVVVLGPLPLGPFVGNDRPVLNGFHRALADGLTETPLLISEPSWLAALEGLGLPGTRAESETALGDALASWDPASGPAYIEFPCDPEAYQAMVAGLR